MVGEPPPREDAVPTATLAQQSPLDAAATQQRTGDSEFSRTGEATSSLQKPSFSIGMHVQICGLKDKPKYNGSLGSLVQWKKHKSRWQVRLIDKTILMVREVNFKAAMAEQHHSVSVVDWPQIVPESERRPARAAAAAAGTSPTSHIRAQTLRRSTLGLQVHEGTTIGEIKQHVRRDRIEHPESKEKELDLARRGATGSTVRLVHAGRCLEDYKDLKDYGIRHGALLIETIDSPNTRRRKNRDPAGAPPAPADAADTGNTAKLLSHSEMTPEFIALCAQ